MPSILYVGDAGTGSTAADRANALARLGAHVDKVPVLPFETDVFGLFDYRIARRFQLGRWIRKMNEIVLDAAVRKYDIVWLDKPWMLRPTTIAELKRRGAYIVVFNNDNPWGKLEDGLWRLLLQSLRYVDLAITPRNANVPDYLAGGVRKVRVSDFGFEIGRQTPPTDTQHLPQQYDVSFIGTPTPDGRNVRPHRMKFLAQISARLPGKLTIFGHGWNRHANDLKFARSIGPAQLDDAYNKVIWSSKVSLSFVNWAQADETSHRAYEITACRGLLVAERSPRLEACFKEDIEALFFTGVDECVAKIEAVLDNRIDRSAISQAGHQRALQSGYDNDSRLRSVIAQTMELRQFFQTHPIPYNL